MLGLGTYAFFWQWSDRAPSPLSLEQMLERTRAFDADVFQICDYPPILTYSEAQLNDLRRRAADLSITLELGTRGISPAHLRRFLELAEHLDVKLLRTMVHSPDYRPTMTEAEATLKAALPAFEAAGVTIALETYEQINRKTWSDW